MAQENKSKLECILRIISLSFMYVIVAGIVVCLIINDTLNMGNIAIYCLTAICLAIIICGIIVHQNYLQNNNNNNASDT